MNVGHRIHMIPTKNNNNNNDPIILHHLVSKPKSKLNFCQNVSPSEYKLRTIHKIMPTPQVFFHLHIFWISGYCVPGKFHF